MTGCHSVVSCRVSSPSNLSLALVVVIERQFWLRLYRQKVVGRTHTKSTATQKATTAVWQIRKVDFLLMFSRRSNKIDWLVSLGENSACSIVDHDDCNTRRVVKRGFNFHCCIVSIKQQKIREIFIVNRERHVAFFSLCISARVSYFFTAEKSERSLLHSENDSLILQQSQPSSH